MILVGDCVELMAGMAEASVDAVVTDPPYGLEFMGKEWDRLLGRGGVGTTDQGAKSGWSRYTLDRPLSYQGGLAAQDWHYRWATEALRVLKPGGHLLAFGGTRTYHRLACAIEDAGFEIRDCLVWMYASGFPKSLDVSKAIDKAAGAEREVVGANPNGRTTVRESEAWARPWNGDPEAGAMHITAPATPEAQRWQGWGTALKPAHEPIVVARKPLAGTVAGNVLEHGTGAINVDGCRVEHDGTGVWGARNTGNTRGEGWGFRDTDGETPCSTRHESGRWPANVVLDEYQEPVLRLRDNVGDDVSDLIRAFFRGYRLRDVRSGGSNSPEPSKQAPLLLEGVLRDVAEREPEGRGASEVRGEALATVDRQDERDEEGPRQASDKGNVDESGLRLHQGAGDGAGSPGASAGHGADSGSTSDRSGSRPSQERDQARQPAGEPGAPLEAVAQDDPLGDGARTSTASQSRLRPELRVVQEDIPAGWLTYFEPTPATVRRGAAAMLDEQTGEWITNPPGKGSANRHSGFAMGALDELRYHGDYGGASRFFYCAKSSRAERNAGLEGFEEREQGQRYGSVQDARPHTVDGYEYPRRSMRNTHPTVKPIALMRWLVRLVTPPGGTVLDPFSGSGTTGIAAALEGFDFIGMEQDADYAKIAEARIAFWTEHGEDGLRIVAERERAEAQRQERVEAGQMELSL